MPPSTTSVSPLIQEAASHSRKATPWRCPPAGRSASSGRPSPFPVPAGPGGKRGLAGVVGPAELPATAGRSRLSSTPRSTGHSEHALAPYALLRPPRLGVGVGGLFSLQTLMLPGQVLDQMLGKPPSRSPCPRCLSPVHVRQASELLFDGLCPAQRAGQWPTSPKLQALLSLEVQSLQTVNPSCSMLAASSANRLLPTFASPTNDTWSPRSIQLSMHQLVDVPASPRELQSM